MLVEYYDLGDLFAADYFGQVRWLVERAGEYYLGPYAGPLLTDHLLAAWEEMLTPPPAVWA